VVAREKEEQDRLKKMLKTKDIDMNNYVETIKLMNKDAQEKDS